MQHSCFSEKTMIFVLAVLICFYFLFFVFCMLTFDILGYREVFMFVWFCCWWFPPFRFISLLQLDRLHGTWKLCHAATFLARIVVCTLWLPAFQVPILKSSLVTQIPLENVFHFTHWSSGPRSILFPLVLWMFYCVYLFERPSQSGRLWCVALSWFCLPVECLSRF